MLKIKNLHASVDGKEILKGIDLEIKAGEVHAIMGPNGAGKSTLSAVLTGRERFEVTQGEVEFNGKNLLEMPAEDRAREGIFLSFQYPVEIPGVSTVNFLKTAVNEIRKYHGQPPYPSGDFLKMIRQKMELVGIDNKLLNRSLNEGFSGGEKKKNEIFQMAVLEPKLAILDETDSGLDIDALRTVANGVNKLKKPENATIVITHYQRLLDYIVPDVVHVLYDGRIVKTAGKELVAELEEKGYDWIKEEVKGKKSDMNDFEKINTDLATLFKEGRALLDAGNSAVMNGCREEAFRKFVDLGGIPNKQEDYIYLNLLPLFDKDYNVVLKYIRQEVDINETFRCAVTDLVTTPVLTVNGWWFDGNPAAEIPEEVVICGLQEASVKYPDLFAKHYNHYAPVAHRDSLVALNTAFAQDGVFVYVPDDVVLERPLQIINLLRAKADLMGFQRNLIVLGKNAKATVLVCDHTLSEHDFLINNTTEVYLGPNAHMEYYQVQNQHLGASQINSLFVSEHRNSTFESNLVTLYGGTIRNNMYVALNEEGGECHLYGMYIQDKKQVVDNFSYIDHIAPHCTSNEHFKGVLDDAALANFSGCIRVRPDAQKTEAYQANNNLLLTDTARINAKPQLIIDADDVKCSHGATVGQIDEEAMFYLRSRGISPEEARMMMMFGFAHDIIRRVKLEPLRVKIDDLIDKRLRGELSKCYNCIMQCKK